MERQDPFSTGLLRRRSGIYFDDVFGGPPTRSVYSVRRSAEESVDSPSSSGREGDGGCRQSASLRTSFGEKPVFGEACSPSSRMKGLNDDFFSDIFKARCSGSSTPRKMDWDAQSSAPGSRILSPAQTMPSRFEPAGAPFMLSPLRDTPKVKKVQGYPVFSSSPDHAPNKTEDTAPHAATYMASILNEVSGAQADKGRDPHHSVPQSDLSFQNFHGKDALLETDDSASIDRDGNFNEDSAHPKDKKRSNQFHFSIYKWASRGVMLVVPSSPKEETKTRGRLSGLPVPFLHGVDLPLNRKNLSSSDRVFPSEFEREDAEVYRGRKITTEFTEAANRTSHETFESMPFPSSDTTVTGVPLEPRLDVPGIETDIGILSKDGSDVSDGELVDKIESSLHRTTSTRSTDNLGETRKKNVKKTTRDCTDAEDTQFEHKMPPGSVKGKVKDFIQIFDQDVSSKPIYTLESRSRRTKAKDMEKNTMVDYERSHGNKLDVEQFNSGGKDEVHSNEHLLEEFVKEEKLDFDAKAEVQRIFNSSSEKDEATIPSVESSLEDIEVLYGDMEGPYFEVEECTVEQVVFQLQDHDDLPETVSNGEESQNSDAKIREWSSGKEGNIRSLLSTLQYVLWSGSGWKVVPLVDLIESSSVRRAYQRALLCLHPDKLQQRGAPEHQKYIAEKVFDILQEAWNQFSSVSPI